MFKQVAKNAAIWSAIAIAVTILTQIFLIELEDKLGEHSGLLIIPVGLYAVSFALTGTVIQGVFIKMHYFQMGATTSILIVGTLILLITETIQQALSSQFDFWFMVILLSIPIYTITAISYFSTRDK